MCIARPLLIEVYRAKGGIGSREILCYYIYPAWPITIVSLAANTYCMMDGHSSCSPRTVGPRVQFSCVNRVNRAIDDRPAHTAGHLLSVVQVATNTERL